MIVRMIHLDNHLVRRLVFDEIFQWKRLDNCGKNLRLVYCGMRVVQGPEELLEGVVGSFLRRIPQHSLLHSVGHRGRKIFAVCSESCCIGYS
jgi:hypothetical protein